MEALAFSGGIDSLATLFLLRERWEKLLVIWCDTQAGYSETAKYMERIQEVVPHFLRIQGNQPEVIRQFGWPADVVPMKATVQGRMFSGQTGPVFQSIFDCCARSIWIPLDTTVKSLGIKVIYKGQRKSDLLRAPISSGYVDETGVEYRFPIEDWTREQVFEFCRKECPELIPEHYSRGEVTSRDCWNCTGYLWENERRIENLPPERQAFVMGKLNELAEAVRKDFPL